jgi:hypothetical protein
MPTISDGDWRVPKCASQRMKSVERCFVQLQNGASPQFERPLLILHMQRDDVDGELELSEAVLGLPTRDLVRIGE